MLESQSLGDVYRILGVVVVVDKLSEKMNMNLNYG